MKNLTPVTKILGLVAFSFCILHNSQAKKKVEYAENRVIVKLKDTPPLSKSSGLDTIKSIMKVKVKKKFKSIGAELWEISEMSVDQAIDTYSSDPSIEYIEPDYMLEAVDIIPNDPKFSQLWGMHNTGQSGGTVDADIDAPEAWSIHTGGDILVGVIDTGVDYNHEDLTDNMWVNPYEIPDDNIDNDDNGYIDDVRGWDFAYNDDDPMDVHGHGTHCSGTIAGIGNNGIGVAGVNWSAKIMALKFLNDYGSGWTSNAVSALEYATAMGVKITSNSWGGGGYSQALYDAIEAAGAEGALFIAAAGNDTEDNDQYPHYPSSYNLNNIISVTSTDRNDQISYFSNWGLISVDLSAPGSSIHSTLPGNTYSSWSGTSMATPHVSGAASLIWSYAAGLTNLQVKNAIMNSVDPVSDLNGKTVTGGRLNVYKALQLAETDSIPPDPVTDLIVTETGSSWIILTWTASGDDNSTGTAASYDIRYSTSEINDGNFNSATQVLDPPGPKESGTSETYKVDSLNFNTTYFFALKVFDEHSNPSVVSNSSSGTTLGIPDIAVSHDTLSDTLYTGETSIKTLTISNEGEGILDFSFPNFSASVLLNTPGIQKNQSSDDIQRIEIAKGEEDPRVGHPVVLGAGGPDDFGYTWIDSDEPGGPVFNWFDISTVGTNSGLSGIDDYVTLNLPFDFKFYGEVKNTVKVSTNGYLTFTSNGKDYTNDPIPTPYVPDDFIAPFWDDLYSGDGNNYYYYDEQNNRFIIQYSDWEYFFGIGFLNFQVHLHENGAIYFYYYQISGTLTSATIGIENIDASDGLQVVFNNNYVHDGLVVCIFKEPEFLSINPTSGSVQSGSSMDIEVTFHTTDLSIGSYDDEILISNNDPDESEITIPAYLNVKGAPDITVSSDTLNFGTKFIGTTETNTLIISNEGTDTLIVSNISSDNSDYTVDTTNFSLKPSRSQEILVTFTPNTEGAITGTLTITNNDSDEATVIITLLGEGLTPPDIAVIPDSLSESLLTGETSTQILIIENTGGGSNLNWEIQISALDSVSWLSISPESGIVGPDSSDTLTVSFDATEINGGEYNVNIVINTNDPDEPEVSIPVNLEVTEAAKITLNSGWNFVSWNIDTENDATAVVLDQIMENLVVALGFEQKGFTFDPSIPSNLNTLQSMDHFHGYELMMTGNKELTVTGNLVDLQTPIILEENWNLVSYLSPHIDSTAHAINSVIDNTIVILGYNSEGLTFDPTLPPALNTLNIMRSGFGYWIKTTNKDTLIYPTDFVASQSISKTLAKAATLKIESQNVKPTGEWISLWGQDITLDGVLLPVGTLVKAVDKDGVICGECTVHHQGMFGLMSIYKDDPRTDEDEGANAGEEVTIYFGDFKVPETVTWTSFGDVINFDFILTAIGGELITIPIEYALHQNYPNPFNPNTTIQYDIPKDTKVTIKVFDILGKEIFTLVDKYQKAGFHKIQWNGKNSSRVHAPSGIYFYMITTDNFKQTKKLILLR